MRFVRFSSGTGHVRCDVLDPDGSVVEFPGEVGDPDEPAWAVSPRQLEAVARSRGATFAADEVRLLAPVTPRQIVAVGRNYEAHAGELGNAVPGEPILFNKLPTCVRGPGEAVELPSDVGRVDHEVELGVVIGRAARRISREEATEVIAGYTVVNDITARELQKASGKAGKPWFLAKNFATFLPVGPCLLTADEVDFPPALELSLRVNGETRQRANTRELIFDLPSLLEYITRWIPLLPGDLIATGTPAGVGPLCAGDTVEAEVEGIGVLSNPVIAHRPDAGTRWPTT